MSTSTGQAFGGVLPCGHHALSRSHTLCGQVCPGSKLTVFQAACIALDQKVRAREPDNITNERCRIIHQFLLPDGNFYPRSMYLLEKAVGCQHVHEVMLHFCEHCYSAFPDNLPKSEWKRHAHDTCTDCEEEGVHSLRFTEQGGAFVPAKWCFYFGVQDTLRELLLDQEFVAAASQMKREDDAYYSSDEAKRLFRQAGKV